MYERCTRETQNGTFKDFYWCPSTQQANDTWAFNGTTYGLCNDFAEPPDNSCADHFFPVGDVCVRVSTIPMTFDNARAKCQMDNTDIAYITDVDIQLDLR